jgi:hypothetical protein
MKLVQAPSFGAMSSLFHHLKQPAPVRRKRVMLLRLHLLWKELFYQPTY